MCARACTLCLRCCPHQRRCWTKVLIRTGSPKTECVRQKRAREKRSCHVTKKKKQERRCKCCWPSSHFNEIGVGGCAHVQLSQGHCHKPSLFCAPARPLVLRADLCETSITNFQVELARTPGGSAGARVFGHTSEQTLIESATSDLSGERAITICSTRLPIAVLRL